MSYLVIEQAEKIAELEEKLRVAVEALVKVREWSLQEDYELDADMVANALKQIGWIKDDE